MQQQDVRQNGRASPKLQVSNEMPTMSVYFIPSCKSEILRDMQFNLFTILLHGHMYSLLLGIIKIVHLSFYDMSKFLSTHSLANEAEAIYNFFLDLC